MKIEVKNNIKIILLIILTLFVLYILHVAIGGIFNNESSESGNKQEFSETKIVFEKDEINKTLIVHEIFSKIGTIYWSEISIANGSANLPEGTIEIGDIITNCEGNLKLVYEKTAETIWEEDFS